jgi:hypothetical protein
MVNQIAVYAEGLTEWYSVYQLYSKDIFTQGKMCGKSDRNDVGGIIKRWKRTRHAMSKLLANPNGIPPCQGILLVFDQENDKSPRDTAKELFGMNFSFDSVNGHDNLFSSHLKNGIQVVLHVATAPSPDGNRDFDGYVLQLIDRLDANAVTIWLDRAPGRIKDQYNKNSTPHLQIHTLGREKIPSLMAGEQWKILRSKTMLYAYITALQADMPHVWFTEKMIQLAPPDALRDVFSDLIAAWDLLQED